MFWLEHLPIINNWLILMIPTIVILISKTPVVPLISFVSNSTTTNNQHNNRQPHNSRRITSCWHSIQLDWTTCGLHQPSYQYCHCHDTLCLDMWYWRLLYLLLCAYPLWQSICASSSLTVNDPFFGNAADQARSGAVSNEFMCGTPS